MFLVIFGLNIEMLLNNVLLVDERPLTGPLLRYYRISTTKVGKRKI